MLRTATRALAVGMTESGKSKLLEDLFVAGHPRVILLDVNGEALDHPREDVIIADGLPQLLRVLKVAAGYDRWRIAAYLDDDETRSLFRQLLERRGAYDQSLCRRFGGVAIECGEVSTLTPLMREKGSLVAQAWLRGRHHNLSLLMAAQSPHRADKIIREQSDYIAAFMQTEPADVAWLEEQLGRAAGDAIRELQQYEFLLWRKGARTFDLYDRHRRRTRRVLLNGTVEWQRAGVRAPNELPAIESTTRNAVRSANSRQTLKSTRH